ncbi:MAG: DUF1624 domain-containing protein [Bdellovibrionales bacterium]|nr:DUF1624 domain-containing protein [Bdellovibrionales bacterium]
MKFEKRSRNSDRLESIDALRGVAIVLMVLDHTRHFFTNTRMEHFSSDLSQIPVALFFVRWLTHFCAPIFILLAGISAFLLLKKKNNNSIGKTSKYLLIRGLWLIIIELTLVRLAWMFNFDNTVLFGRVLWAIGWSFVFLSPLIYLSPNIVGIIGAVIILTHNLFDTLPTSSWGSLTWLWKILHVSQGFEISEGYYFLVIYPLIPWVGVMALGYGIGQVFLKPKQQIRKILGLAGLSLLCGFIILRFINLYGDPMRWSPQPTALQTMMSFIQLEKYPASLLFLMLTLGITLVLFPYLERIPDCVRKVFVTFGRVPLFFYCTHLFFIHGLAVTVAYVQNLNIEFLLENRPPWFWPANWGFSFPVIFLIWVVVVAVFYPICFGYTKLLESASKTAI